MDFEKLKKAAKETLKIVSSKVEETIDTVEEMSTEPEVAEDKKDDAMGQTQKIDLRSVFDLFRSKKQSEDNEDELESEADTDTAAETECDPEPEDEEGEDISSESSTTAGPEEEAYINIPSDEDKAQQNVLKEIDKKLSDFSDSQKTAISDMTADIAGVKADIENLKQTINRTDLLTSEINDTLVARLNNTDSKLNSISNSLAGIAKLNDSIFDLKNSQMNTKNSIGDLEANFYKLKRKMTTGVLLISIITAVIAILEIINLLS